MNTSTIAPAASALAVAPLSGSPASTPVSKTGKSPIEIREILLNVSPSFDDIVARLIATKFGERWFNGISAARTVYVQGSIYGNNAYYDERKQLPIGIGSDEKTICRFKRTSRRSATIAVANHIELAYRPMNRIVDEVDLCVTGGGATPTSMHGICRGYNRQHPSPTAVEANTLKEWAETGINAVADQEASKRIAEPDEFTLRDYFASYAKSPGLNEEALGLMNTLIEESMSRKDGKEERVTELAHAVGSMLRNGKSPVDVSAWLGLPFEVIYNDQIAFLAERARLQKNGLSSVKVPDACGTTHLLKIMLVIDGNPLSHAAAKSLKANIIGIFDAKGYLDIMTNDLPAGVNVDDMVRMLRWTVMAKDHKAIIARDMWQRLGKVGVLQETGMFFYKKSGRVLLARRRFTQSPGLTTKEVAIILRDCWTTESVQAWGIKQLDAYTNPHRHLR